MRLTTVRSPVKAAAAAQWKTTLRIQDQSEIAKAAAKNRAALVTLLKAAEAVEQSEAVSPGDGTVVDYAAGAVGYTSIAHAAEPDQTEVAEKNNQMKTIKLAMMAGQIMVEAFRQDIVEATIAEQLGILALLGQIQTALAAERGVLAGWLNQRGRGEFRL